VTFSITLKHYLAKNIYSCTHHYEIFYSILSSPLLRAQIFSSVSYSQTCICQACVIIPLMRGCIWHQYETAFRSKDRVMKELLLSCSRALFWSQSDNTWHCAVGVMSDRTKLRAKYVMARSESSASMQFLLLRKNSSSRLNSISSFLFFLGIRRKYLKRNYSYNSKAPEKRRTALRKSSVLVLRN
jgi:hypothetical protein